jgi:hypothetical protein
MGTVPIFPARFVDPPEEEAAMAETTVEKGIQWRQDFEAALVDAKSQSRDVLVDFSAAPM